MLMQSKLVAHTAIAAKGEKEKKPNIAVTKSDTLRAPSGGENIATFQPSKGGEGKPNTNIKVAIIAKSYLSIFEVLKGQV